MLYVKPYGCSWSQAFFVEDLFADDAREVFGEFLHVSLEGLVCKVFVDVV